MIIQNSSKVFGHLKQIGILPQFIKVWLENQRLLICVFIRQVSFLALMKLIPLIGSDELSAFLRFLIFDLVIQKEQKIEEDKNQIGDFEDELNTDISSLQDVRNLVLWINNFFMNEQD